ncbi:uncharacterized protein [Leptinotarsa decemlineata]|uniref:uncharacterized protein n=1 Tax=Leptinotarsa decemlineata TaxID=7539 RepID=UPI003D30A3B1
MVTSEKKNEKQLLTILAKKGKEARDSAMKSHIINRENEIINSDHDYVISNAEEITADVDLHCLIEEPDSVTTHTPNVKRKILTPTRKRKCNPPMKKMHWIIWKKSGSGKLMLERRNSY